MPRLRCVQGAQKSQVFLIGPPGPVRIGRDLDASVPLFDPRSSRNHCEIRFTNEGYELNDLDSRLGTVLNDQKITQSMLKSGDLIQLGASQWVFELDVADALTGRTLGDYEILEPVGSGGLGTVYRARQLSLERIVAVKVLHAARTTDSDFCALFVREARAAAELSSPHIVRVYDVNNLEGVLFYVMEFTAAGSVADRLRRHGTPSLSDTLSIVIQACRGLEYAEKVGIVHRDIKPANFLVTAEQVVKIGDLGIAVGTREEMPDAFDRLIGTPAYMSPEQITEQKIDHRADLYSLGISLYEIISGTTPFRTVDLKELLYAQLKEEPPDIRASHPHLPEALGTLINQLLAKSPEDRPDSAGDVRRRLEIVAENLDPQADRGVPVHSPGSPGGTAGSPRSESKRPPQPAGSSGSPWPVVAGIIVFAAALAAAYFLTVSLR